MRRPAAQRVRVRRQRERPAARMAVISLLRWSWPRLKRMLTIREMGRVAGRRLGMRVR